MQAMLLSVHHTVGGDTLKIIDPRDSKQLNKWDRGARTYVRTDSSNYLNRLDIR